jgi:hypothetical protein
VFLFHCWGSKFDKKKLIDTYLLSMPDKEEDASNVSVGEEEEKTGVVEEWE